MNRLLACLFALLFLAADLSAQVDDRSVPYKGVLWERPADLAQAATDLHRMHEVGIEAVRTGLIMDERLLILADTLRIQIFQELPVHLLPASHLADTLAYARQQVLRILRQAAAHSSVRHIGLARRVDTSAREACAYFDTLSDLIDAADSLDVRGYYTSLFIEDDVCGDTVDLVLYDGVVQDGIEDLAQRWTAEHDTPFGVAAAGRWVAAEGPSGYRAPHSPEGQARYLEDALTTAFRTTTLYAVFVNRWRDAVTETPAFTHDPLRPYDRPYGLLDGDDAPRPAFRVVRGLYTGEQEVFALPAGSPPSPQHWSVPILFGWGVLLVLGLLYGQNVHFRDGLRRYFVSHGFYIETVSRGREIDLLVNGLLLTIFSLAAGVVGTILVHLLYRWPPLVVLMSWSPGRFDVLLLQILARPWVGIVFLGTLFALVQVLWAVGLSPLAGLRRRMSGPQHLMLVLWPRWPVLLVAVAALAVISLPPERHTPTAGLLLAAVWFITTAWSRMCTLSDYALARHVAQIRILATGLGLFVLFLGGFLLILIFAGVWPEFEFLTHLATRN